MIYTPALRSFLKRRLDAIDVLEIEPQTLWRAEDAIHGPYQEFSPLIDAIASLPMAKLVHSVGVPLGGTRKPHPQQLSLLKATADLFDSPWVSEHMSVAGTPDVSAAFLLPPLQTQAGVKTAVDNIRAFQAAIGRPVAIETNVSYIRRKPFEMEDGAFFAAIAEQADCGILLDLHNIYCNERNGRGSLEHFVAALPLDRVWEVHLAGGSESEGFWLDAHNGPMQRDLARRARSIMRALPNLGAINFEIYETFLDGMPASILDGILDEMRGFWSEAGSAAGDGDPRLVPASVESEMPAPVDPAAWETGFTEAVWKCQPALHPFPEDGPALQLYARLARSFRGSMLLRVLPRALSYLILRDADHGEAALAQFFDAVPPKLYAVLEAWAFQSWVSSTASSVADPLLVALIDYDTTLFEMVLDPNPRLVRFPGDPRAAFEALGNGRLPSIPLPPVWEIEILPDGTGDAIAEAAEKQA